MMGKFVTEDEGYPKPFKPQLYQSNRGRNQSRGNFCGRFRNNTYRGCPLYNQNLEEETIITIIGETIIEVKAMIEIEVGH